MPESRDQLRSRVPSRRAAWTDLAANIGSLIVFCCLILVTTIVVRERVWPQSVDRGTTLPPPRHVDGWEAIMASGVTVGEPTAPVRVAVFSDYQCPYCAAADSALWRRHAAAPTRLAIAFHDFPLAAIHPFAVQGAMAAECARRQGKFAEFHQAVFREQAAIGVKDWTSFARDVGVADSIAFRTCLASKAGEDRIAKDMALGRELQIAGTPTIMINDLLLPAGAPLDSILARIDSAVARAGSGAAAQLQRGQH